MNHSLAETAACCGRASEKLNSIPGLHYKVILLKSNLKDSFVDVGDIQMEKGSFVFSAPTTNLNQNMTTVIDIMPE